MSSKRVGGASSHQPKPLGMSRGKRAVYVRLPIPTFDKLKRLARDKDGKVVDTIVGLIDAAKEPK